MQVKQFKDYSQRTPKVSVCIVTYNHKDYIEHCIQSLLDQEVDFEYEIIVSDDCSTDGTANIIKRLAAQNAKIRTYIQERNIGAYKNFLYVHSLARGKYIAHMDGDDYALPGKLSIQAKFLDTHTECNLVFHRVLIDFGDGRELVADLMDIKKIPQNGFRRSDVIRHITVGINSSKMYRKPIDKPVYPEFNIIDYFESVIQVADGTACYANDKFYGVYRAGIGIASSGLATKIATCDSLEYFSNKYPKEKSHVGAASLLLFLVDAKNLRKTWKRFLKIWLQNFTLNSFWLLYKDRHITQMLRLPKKGGSKS